MKLQLSEHYGVQVLTVVGSIAGQNAKILRAGIAKLFKAGKNRLVLDVRPPPEIDEETVKEIGIMNQLARELAGEIVLVVEDLSARKRVELLSKAAPLKCYATKAEGIAVFQASSAKATAAVAVTCEKHEEEIKNLKDQLRAKETGELSSVRSEVSRLKSELAKLEDQFEKMMIQRRAPAEEKGYLEKISLLEGEVRALNAQIVNLEAARGQGN